MLSIYFVRHGQTEFSLGNKFCGTLDPSLNDVGVQMAAALGRKYGPMNWNAIYASPMLRTRQTAQAVADVAGAKVVIEEGLHEIDYGEWEGRAEAEVEAAEPERFAAWARHPGKVSPPGGETAVQIIARAMPVIEKIRATQTGNVLVVSHKATIRVLICALLGIDVDLFRARIGQRVCAVSIVEFKKTGPLLQVLGDISHLPPELIDAEGT